MSDALLELVAVGLAFDLAAGSAPFDKVGGAD
ncbi:hypothetical protein P3T37_000335 [Kitasatospora sp. MAA4]|nr:hypothetical protein [Kitasatospora sp. MAA4]